MSNQRELIERGSKLLRLLGSFWNSLYAGWDQLASYANAKNQAELQTYQDMVEALACASRFTVPIFHRKNWTLLTLRQSQRLSGRLLNYGDPNIVHGNNPGNGGTVYQYGVAPSRTFDYNEPDKLRDCPVVMNRMTAPSLVWTKGIDFVIDPDNYSIRFRDDPFAQSLIPTRPVYDDSGNWVDTELSLWLYHAEYDWAYIYEQFAYAIGVYVSESTETYRTLVNAIWDAALIGSTRAHLELVLATLTDTPVIIETREVVEDIYQDSTCQWVITDKHAYRVASVAKLVVSKDQQLRAGQPLTDAYTLYDPVRDMPPANKIPALSMGSGFLLGTYASDITFSNKAVPLKVMPNYFGRTRVEFELGGVYSDIQTFWDRVHTAGTAPGAISLAQLMDTRYPPAQTPDPQAINLPATVNPLEFLLRNVLRNNALVAHLNVASFGEDALGTNYPKIFRLVTPSQNALLIISQVSLAGSADTVPMNGAGTPTATGYTETVVPAFTAPDPLAETSPHSFVGAESFAFSSIPG